MKKTLYYFFTLWIILWLQVISHHYFGGTYFSVQWAFLATLHFGLTRGSRVGQSVGFTWGLLLDAASLGTLGLQAMLFAIAGYMSGSFRRQLDASKLWTQTIFSAVVSFGYLVAYFILSRILFSGEEMVRWSALTVPLLNACVAPLVFRVLEQWAQLWDMTTPERSM